MSEKRKILVIINPMSGSTSSKGDIAEKIALLLDQKKNDLCFKYTGYAGHATEIATEAVKNKCDVVIAIGGDGTVNEVAKALVNTDVTLGIIPFGSGNGLARDLNIPINISKAIKIIQQDNVRKIDYGIANGHTFFCTCGVGFDAFVSKRFAQEKKRGALGYLKNMLESVFEFKPEEYEITYDDGKICERAFVVTCANASQYGNDAYIAPNADMEDGKMNLSILKPINTLEMPHTTIQLFTKNIEKNHKLIHLLSKRVIIKRSNKGVMHVDGESIKTGREINVEIVQHGLNVFAPILNNKNIKPKNYSVLEVVTRWFN